MGEAADDLIESGMFYEDEEQGPGNVEYQDGFPMYVFALKSLILFSFFFVMFSDGSSGALT